MTSHPGATTVGDAYGKMIGICQVSHVDGLLYSQNTVFYLSTTILFLADYYYI